MIGEDPETIFLIDLTGLSMINESQINMDKATKKKRILSTTKARPSALLRQKNWEREKRYLALLDNLPVGIYRTTPDGRIIEANPALAKTADEMCQALEAAGVDVLYDDRDERAGVKFHDADLFGIPYVMVIGRRLEREGVVEVRERRSGVEKAVTPEAARAALAKGQTAGRL